MSEMTGRVLSVKTQNLGEPTVAAAAIGDTVLWVADAATFDEGGGYVTINGGDPVVYLTIDTDADTITLAAALSVALDEQTRIDVSPATPEKTALVALDGGGDVVTATVPHTLLDKFPDGGRDDSTAESVTLVQRGSYELVIADAISEPLTQVSLDYVEAEAGIGLSTAVAQVQDVQALSSVATPLLIADAVSLAGGDLGAQLDAIPGATVWASTATSSSQWAGPTTSTTELRCFVFDCGQVKAGQAYTLKVIGILAGTVDNDVFWVRFRYTEDGSEPTTSSPVLRANLVGPVISTRANLALEKLYAPAADARLKVAVTLQRRSGTGSGKITTSAGDSAFQVALTPLGGSVNAASSLQQTAKADGSGSDNTPVSTFTKTFSATWAIGVDDDGSPIDTSVWSNTYVTVGNDAFSNPNTFGLVGFDSTAIQAALAGVVTPVSCKIRFRVRGRKSSGGLDVRFLTHTYASLGSAQAANLPYVNYSNYPSTIVYTSGNYRLNAAPGGTLENELGTALFALFANGTRKGVGFTNHVGGNDGSGSVYGDGTYQVQLVFTYQGTS